MAEVRPVRCFTDDGDVLPLDEIFRGLALSAELILPSTESAGDEGCEGEASKDVTAVIAAAKPLVEQLRLGKAELDKRLTSTRKKFALSTRDARQRAMDQLDRMRHLREACSDLQGTISSARKVAEDEERHVDEKKQSTKMTADAQDLAATYRALLLEKNRMQLVFDVVRLSEIAHADVRTLRASQIHTGSLDEAIKSCENFRSFVEKSFGREIEAQDSPPSRGNTATRQADVNIVSVARQRLRWLTQHHRAYFSAVLASSIRVVDPLSAEKSRSGDSAARGLKDNPDARRRDGQTAEMNDPDQRSAIARAKADIRRLLNLQLNTIPEDDVTAHRPDDLLRPIASDAATRIVRAGQDVWAINVLLKPVVARFRFHFEGDRASNRTDRPEWFLSFLLRALDAYRPLLEESDHNNDIPATHKLPADVWAHFGRALALLARRRLRRQLIASSNDVFLLSHTVEEALLFDKQLDLLVGYQGCPERYPGPSWPRCVEVFAQDEDRFERWMELDAAAAEAKLSRATSAPGAWDRVDWKNGARLTTPVTPSALTLCRIFGDITERYKSLQDPVKQLRFASRVQGPLLQAFRNMISERSSACRLKTVFRDTTAEVQGAGKETWATAIDTALGGGTDLQGPVSRWRGHCLAISTCVYVRSALIEFEDELLVVQMGEAARAKAQAVADEEAAGRVGGPSLAAMGSAVEAAVGSVTQVVSTVATGAETATAEVARAVGAQGTIIGPAHAITAALSTIKDAARRVHRSSEAVATGEKKMAQVHAEPPSSDNAATTDPGEPLKDIANDTFHGRKSIRVQEEMPCASADGEAHSPPLVTSSAGRVADDGPKLGGSNMLVFSMETKRYESLLETMMSNAIQACREGFLWWTRSYLRAWERGLAVVIPGASVGQEGATAEPSGRLLSGVDLLTAALDEAEGALPAAQFRKLWATLAMELDTYLVQQIVHRREEIVQDEGLQLVADLKVLMAPFSIPARRRPERHFPLLTETAILISLEKSQLRSLSSGLDAHGGGVAEVRRGRGWEGWRQEGGSLTPEGSQMRDMLENIGVKRLGPAEASTILAKRLRGDHSTLFSNLSLASTTSRPLPETSRGQDIEPLEEENANGSGKQESSVGGAEAMLNVQRPANSSLHMVASED